MSLSCPEAVACLRQTKGNELSTILTPEERLGNADQELQALKNSFVEAIGQLQGNPHIDGSFHERLVNVAARLRELRHGLRPEDFDKAQINEFHSALLDIYDLIAEQGEDEDLDIADRLLVCIERVRHVIRDALDEHVAGVPDDAGLVIQEIKNWLPNTSNEVIGSIVGVDRRTLPRWMKESRPASRRLQLVARLIAILRHNWTEEGIVAWFQRPREGLNGKRPLNLLDDASAEDLLLAEARSGRSQYAS
jgi:uncharacterized protein (DUF2384 family)